MSVSASLSKFSFFAGVLVLPFWGGPSLSVSYCFSYVGCWMVILRRRVAHNAIRLLILIDLAIVVLQKLGLMRHPSRFSTPDRRPHRSHIYKERKAGPALFFFKLWDIGF